MADKGQENVPGFYTHKVGSVSANNITPEALEELRKMPGVDTDFVERPDGKREIKVTVNTMVPPNNKKKP